MGVVFMSIIRKDVIINMGKPDILKWLGDLLKLKTNNKTSVVDAINEQQDKIDGLSSNVGDKNNLTTLDKTSTVNAINETINKFNTLNSEISSLKSSVNDGKQKIATAIVDKGGNARGSDTFRQLANEISYIQKTSCELSIITAGLPSWVRDNTCQFYPLKYIKDQDKYFCGQYILGYVYISFDDIAADDVIVFLDDVYAYDIKVNGEVWGVLYYQNTADFNELLRIEVESIRCKRHMGVVGHIVLFEEKGTYSSASSSFSY